MAKKVKVVEAVIEEEKPFFLPRAIAYIIDSVIVFMICLCIGMVLPQDKNHEKYVDEYKKIQADYIDKKITQDEYIEKSKAVVYDIDYTNTASSLVNVVILIGYYIVFQYYNKGMTIGKKVMKLKVVSEKGDLSMNQVALRAILVDSVLINLLLVGSVLFMNENYYYYASVSLQGLESLIIIACLLMILFRKDGKGLHDVLAKTKVVKLEV